MPDTNDSPEQPVSSAETPPAPAPPSFVPIDEFKAFQQTISQSYEALNAGIQALNATLAAKGQERPVAPSAPAISEDDYAKAIVEGDTKTIASYVRQEKIRQREEQEQLIKTHVDPIRTTGLTSIGDLTARQAAGELKHFKRFEKEIKDMVSGLPPEQRLNPQVWEIAHNAVVGKHMDEIMLQQREEILRQGAAATQAPGDGGMGRGKDDKNRVPSLKELLGDDAAATLDSKGLTPDEFSKKLGYKGGWAEYAAQIKQQREGVNV